MATAASSSEEAPNPGGLPWTRRRPRLHRNLNRGFALMLVLFAAGQVYLRFLSFQVLGPSLPNLVTYGMIVVTTVAALLWLIFCSRFDRRLVWGVAIPVVLAIVSGIALIRRAHFDGDMRLSFEWRWQPTSDQRFEEWRSKQGEGAAAPGESASEVVPEDMPGYRGANRDGVVIGPSVSEDWQESPPGALWKHPVGGGYGQVAVAGNLAVALEQRGREETLVCYDASSGRELWKHGWPAKFDEAMGGPGPRSTPTIAEGRVYAFGALGHIVCADLRTGAPAWSRELLQELGLENSTWGMTSSPLVVDDRLVVNVGGYYGGGLVALDRATGDIVWQTEAISATRETPPPLVADALREAKSLPPRDDGDHAAASSSERRNFAGYASPIVATIDGVRQILNLDGLGLWGHAIEDGRPLWFHHFKNDQGVNSAQPIVFEDGRILISASYGVGSRMVRVAKKKSAAGWDVHVEWGDGGPSNLQLRSKMSSPVLVDGYVYGLDEGILVCLDPATGKRLWKGTRKYESTGRYGHGQLLATNGRILVLTERGDIVLIRPQPDELVELGRVHLLDSEKSWNPPALVRGKLYVRNHHEMACVDLCPDGPSGIDSSASEPDVGTGP